MKMRVRSRASCRTPEQRTTQREVGSALGVPLAGGLVAGLAPLGEEEDFVFVGAGPASGLALAGAAPLVGAEGTGVTAPLGADEVEAGFVAVTVGPASRLALAGAAPLVDAEGTGVTAALGFDEVGLARPGGAAGFSSGELAARPADSDAGWAPVWATVDTLPPNNCSGPALARISVTCLGLVSNGEWGKSATGRSFRISLINCIQMGSATRAPSSLLPSVWWSSKPT